MIHSAVSCSKGKGYLNHYPKKPVKVERPKPSSSSTMKWKYKEKYSLEERKKQSSAIMAEHSDHIPLIIEKVTKSRYEEIPLFKWIVFYDLTMSQFIYILRRRMKLSDKESIFVFIEKTLPQASATLGELWTRHRDEDGFLYLAYSEENTFGLSS